MPSRVLTSGFILLERQYGERVEWIVGNGRTVDLETGDRVTNGIKTITPKALVIQDDIVDQDQLSLALAKMGGNYNHVIKTVAMRFIFAPKDYEKMGKMIITDDGGSPVEYTIKRVKKAGDLLLVKVQ